MVNKPKVLVFGDANIDLIIRNLKEVPKMGQEIFIEDMEMCVGGSAANVAVGLAKLEVDTSIYTTLSDDQFGRYILKYFEEVNLSTEHIHITHECKTGISIGITNKEDRSFISYMGTNELFGLNACDLSLLKEFSHIHLSAYNLDKCLQFYLSLVKHCGTLGCTLSLDLGWTDFGKHKEELLELLKYIDIFFPNIHEAKELTGAENINEMLSELSKYVKGAVVITAGDKGAYAYHNNRIYHRIFQVEAIDAIGAGDAFDAGFISAYLNKEDIKKCVDYGCACGAMAVSAIGGSISSPTKSQLVNFLKNNVENGIHNIKGS